LEANSNAIGVIAAGVNVMDCYPVIGKIRARLLSHRPTRIHTRTFRARPNGATPIFKTAITAAYNP
jgi:hypothetical protein